MHSHCWYVNFSRYCSQTHRPDTPCPTQRVLCPPATSSLPYSISCFTCCQRSISNSSVFFVGANASTAICLCAYVHRNVRSAAASFMVAEPQQDSAVSSSSIVLESSIDLRIHASAGSEDSIYLDRSRPIANAGEIADCRSRARQRRSAAGFANAPHSPSTQVKRARKTESKGETRARSCVRSFRCGHHRAHRAIRFALAFRAQLWIAIDRDLCGRTRDTRVIDERNVFRRALIADSCSKKELGETFIELRTGSR